MARIYKPDSVGPTVPVGASNRLIIYLGEPSPTPSIDLPVPATARKRCGDEQPRIRYIFGLSAPKVYPAPLVAQRAVVSYTPFSPLPKRVKSIELVRQIAAQLLTLHFPGGIFSVTLAVERWLPAARLPVRK